MNEKLGAIAIAIAFIALLVSGGAYVTLKGEAGDPGVSGPVGPVGPAGGNGPKGDKGDQGDDGDPGINGTDGAQGPKGNSGAKGDKGDTGNKGLDGADGINGTDGIDLEPNEAPTTDVDTSESYVEGCEWSDDYHYYLNITLNDLELDLMKVYLYTRWDEGCNWDYINAWPMVANGTYLNYHKEKSGNGDWGNKTLYWLIEVMDGENLVYDSGFTTLEKLHCP